MSSTDIYFPNKHYQSKNKETSRIIRKGSRKGSERWSDHVHHKRSSNSYRGIYPRYSHRSQSIITPRLSQKHPIIQDCISYYKDYHEINNDDIIKHQENNIPVWVCNRCTYNNIERKSCCKVCYLEYSKSNMIYKPMVNIHIDTDNCTEFSLLQFMKSAESDKNHLSYNGKTVRNRKRRRKSRQKKLKKILAKSEHEKWLDTMVVRHPKKIKHIQQKENVSIEHQKKNVSIEHPTNNISIMIKMSLKPIVKYQYIAPKLLMTRDYNRKCGYSFALMTMQNFTETYSMDNPVKLKNFELLEIQLIVKDNTQNKPIKSFIMSPKNEKRVCFPIVLCEHSWVDLSLIPMNNKIFEIVTRSIKQCIPQNVLVNDIKFEYDSIHEPNYNLLPICDDMSRILIEYMPSMDIIHNILLEYIGYKQVGYLYMNVKNSSFIRKCVVQFSEEKVEYQNIEIDYDSYQYIYSPTDDLYRNDHGLEEEYDTISSSSLHGNLFGGDSSSDDSSSDDSSRNVAFMKYLSQLRRNRKYDGTRRRTPCTLYEKSDDYCRPERIAKITKYPLKYMKVRSPNRYLQRKWNAYYKLRNDYFEY